jgi:hypothetical protein
MDSVLVVEVLYGPYAGHIVRIGARGGRFFQIRPRFGDHPLVWYERVDLDGGDAVLRHALNKAATATLGPE